MPLTVGHIAYLNCVPFFHHLRQCGFTGPIVPGVPAQLNGMLQRGEVDICPSSSFEYGVNARDYLLLPDRSISSDGPVGSVLLISPVPPGQLQGIPIALTGESATSVNLLRVLLREFHGVTDQRDEVPRQPVEEVLRAGRPALLIGDRALRAARQAPPDQVYDLGELWRRQTGLPFVFALWMVREEVARQRPREVARFAGQLGESLALGLAALPALASQHRGSAGLSETELLEYWQLMSYGLDDRHRRGLQLYFELCARHGLLAEAPPLRFFDSDALRND